MHLRRSALVAIYHTSLEIPCCIADCMNMIWGCGWHKFSSDVIKTEDAFFSTMKQCNGELFYLLPFVIFYPPLSHQHLVHLHSKSQ